MQSESLGSQQDSSVKLARVSVALHGDSNRPSKPHLSWKADYGWKSAQTTPGLLPRRSAPGKRQTPAVIPNLLFQLEYVSVHAVLKLYDKSLKTMS